MAKFDPTAALALTKAKLGIRVNSLDETHLIPIVKSAYAKLTDTWGIVYDEAKPELVELLADYAAWKYKNRDNSSSMPQWLRLEIRETFFHSHAQEAANGTTI